MRRKLKSTLTNLKSITFGALIGIINGFLGGGGGMLTVPIIESVYKKSNKQSHALALTIMLPICIVSGFIYALNNYVSWDIVGYVSLGAVIGAVIGAYLLKKLNANLVRFVFAILLLIAGLKIVVGV